MLKPFRPSRTSVHVHGECLFCVNCVIKCIASNSQADSLNCLRAREIANKAKKVAIESEHRTHIHK